jgi:outer membrane biosynthesis protein TonB
MKHSLAKLALGAALLSVACRDKAANEHAKADSDLARDLALASAQTQQPTFTDTAMSPEPTVAAPKPKPQVPAPVKRRTEPKPAPKPRVVAQAPAPAPEPPPAVVQQPIVQAPAPAPIQAEIGAGAAAAMTSGSKICTNTNLPGDKLTATLITSLTGTNGAVIPAGATVVLELASATAGKDAESAQLTFRVRSIVVNDKTYDVQADASPLDPLQQSKVAGDPNGEKKKVIGGAIAGAILGQIIGHNTKGTLIGAATGAAAGAAASRMGEKWEACLPTGAAMRLKLNAPIIIS